MPEDQAPADQQDQPETPETSPPGEASAEGESFAPYDPADLPEEARPAYDAAYKRMQAAFTDKTTSLAEERRQAEQAIALVEALRDPEQQAQALQALGLEFADTDEDLEDDEYVDDEDELRARLEALEAEREEDLSLAEEQQLEEAEIDYLSTELEGLEQRVGQQLSDEEAVVIADLARSSFREQDGRPNLDRAYEALDGVFTQRQKRYVESKRTPQVAVGSAGQKQVDLNDDEARQNMMAEIVNSEGSEE